MMFQSRYGKLLSVLHQKANISTKALKGNIDIPKFNIGMPNIVLNQQLKRLEVSSFELENTIVYNYFNNLPSSERSEKFLRAIYIGVLALMEDRISSFLAKTNNELGTELESLKMLFDMKLELFYKSSIKGRLAEEDIAEYLNRFFNDKKIKDKAFLRGNIIGSLSKNRTGDIVCQIDDDQDYKIVIECKFDKSIKLGEIENRDIFIKKQDTAWSQLIEAQINREAQASIIVFDISLIDSSILRTCENVGYISGIGFIAVINSQKGDYTNLTIAYMLARDIVLNTKALDIDKEFLTMIVNRIIKDITGIISIKTLIESNIDNNKAILKQIEKSILLMEFNQSYLIKFLKDGTLTRTDLLNFYTGENIKNKFRMIEKEIDDI